MLVGYYARVSTDLQTTDGQIDALNAAGYERVFEESMSGPRPICCHMAIHPDTVSALTSEYFSWIFWLERMIP
jgi:hypothetical protein